MFTVSRSARLLVIVPFAALLVAACEHNLGLGATPPGPLATITVTPNPQILAISAIRPFVATGRDAAGNLVAIAPVWSVTAGGGAINIGSGLFTAGTVAGTFNNTVRATSGAISGTATVTVTAPGGLAAITVSPNPGSALVGEDIQFTAAGQDATGAVVTISPAATWSVVNGGGTIDASSGLFTAGPTQGTYTNTIRATSGGISGFATAIVTVFVSPVSLGAAETHGILAGSAITCADGAIPYSTIYADVSLSPGTLSSITGFPPCVITGLRSADDSPNAPYAANAQAALLAAYNQVGAMPCDSTIAALPSGTTLAPGVYCSPGSTIIQTGTLTLNGGGDQNAIFVFKAGSSLTTAGSVILSGGAQAKNVYWWNGASATLGINSAWQGNVLAQSTITLVGNVTLCGRALALTGAVNLDGDNDIIRLPPAAPPTCTFP